MSEFFFIKMANGIRTQNFRMPAERTTNSATDPHGRAQPLEHATSSTFMQTDPN